MTKSRNLIRPKWRPTDAQVELVRTRFATTKTADLAAELGVAYHQVSRLADRLGLQKSEEFLNGPAGGRLDGVRGSGSRFQKGHVPWTKGKKLGPNHGNPDTQFKPGQKPSNYAPVGSIRVFAGEYLQIKLFDTGYPPHDWVMYHRHVWEQAHGPIPEGHVVAFRGEKSLDPKEITVDRLECMSLQEHMRRYTLHNYPPDLVQVMQLRGAITRQINKRSKETA